MRYLSLLALLLVGCAVSAPPLPEEMAAAIPDGANTLELRSSLKVNDLYEQTKTLLLDQGYTIMKEDDLALRIDTDPQEVGSRTALRLTLRASPVGNGSRLEALGYWSSDTPDSGLDSAGSGGVSGTIENWTRAEWGANRQSTYAFGQVALLFDMLPHVETVYMKK